ncbi:MAG: hypothetical protein JXR68_10935 [Bacteroidales bacterium]|nr:hypothetical protein [Bacteroidales bacterium]
MKKIYTIFLLLSSLLLNLPHLNAQVAVNTTGAAPNSSAMLDVSATNKGILIPRVTLTAVNDATTIPSPANGLMVFHTGTGSMQEGFYFWSSTDSNWKLLYSGNVPSVPGNTVYWVRPTGMPYIQPEGNDYIRVNDAGESYGLYYNGATNQYGIFSRTTDGTGTTAAIVGFSDVTGNQTYGYLGYNGTWNPPAYSGFGAINGAAVYGVVDDPGRIAGFFRTTSNASYAANIGYSDVWIAGYYYADVNSTSYNSRPALYGQMNVFVDKAGYQNGIKGISFYEGSGGTSGISTGGSFIGIGYSQKAVGSYGYAYGETAGLGYLYELSNSVGAVGLSEHSGLNYPDASMYQFGVIGQKYQDWSGSYGYDLRSGGVLGVTFRIDNSTIQSWGALGYKSSSGVNYGAYFGTGGSGAGGGKKPAIAQNIGFGSNSDLMGGWVSGDIYGLAVSGDRFSLYVDGRQYNNDVITQFSNNGSDIRTSTYVPTSTSVDIIAKGTAILSEGKATIIFDENFTNIVSASEPIIITVTPQGKTQGVYVDAVKNTGFIIAENNDGKSSTTVNWIAIGTKKGYENIDEPTELISNDFDNNLKKVMFNETLTGSASPIWWDGQQLRFDAITKDIDKSIFTQPVNINNINATKQNNQPNNPNNNIKN